MTSTFHFLGEPLLEFGHGQTAEDPHDGLSLFGPAEPRSQLPDNIVIGTERGIEAWKGWCEALNTSAACVDPSRHLSRVGVIRPPGVGIYRPPELAPKGISKHPVDGAILPR